MVICDLHRTNAQGPACHVADDQIERIAAGHPLADGGCLLGKGEVMSVPDACTNAVDASIPALGDRWGIHCPQLTRTGHGSWYLTIELSTGPTGARRRLRRGGYRTRAQAQRALAGLRQPHPADPRRALLTTAQWLAHWLATRLRPRPATLRSYHPHLVPHLGGILLRELCLDDVQTTFAILARTPTRYGRARAAATLHRIRATLRVARPARRRSTASSATADLPRRHLPSLRRPTCSSRCAPPSTSRTGLVDTNHPILDRDVTLEDGLPGGHPWRGYLVGHL
jgi:hypothetical protein